MKPIHWIFQQLRDHILPEEAKHLDRGLLYWQYEFFLVLSIYSVLGGAIAFAFGLLSYLREGFSFMVPVVSALFLMLVGLAFLKGINFLIRRVISSTLFLCFGLYFLSIRGYQGTGLSFLLAYPIVTGVLLGPDGSKISLGINVLVLGIHNWVLYTRPGMQANFGNYTPLSWLAITVTFLVLCALINLSISRLLVGLSEALETEKSIRTNLEEEILRRRALQAELSAERLSLQQRVEQRTVELQKANTDLENAMKFKDMFLATVSHELRTPIHAISGYSHLLMKSGEETFSEKQRGYLARLDDSSEHLLQVINDILDITRIQAGKLDLKLESIPLRETCESAAHFVRVEASRKNIQVNVIFQDPVESIIADPQRFKQVLINLLSNAVKFTPDNGIVGVTVERMDAEIALEVWDTGIGIAEEDQPKLFSTFYRGSHANTEDVQGTGLGLALVKNLVEAHGWTITLDSTKDEGSSFVIRIPHNQQRGGGSTVAPLLLI
ncbi:MAG: HAMP domain-containing histidine kinase [Anaerolineae bacterium]|nr:HAMP domain-containing histidine kinase [Anaerolineae bacterium]